MSREELVGALEATRHKMSEALYEQLKGSLGQRITMVVKLPKLTPFGKVDPTEFDTQRGYRAATLSQLKPLVLATDASFRDRMQKIGVQVMGEGLLRLVVLKGEAETLCTALADEHIEKALFDAKISHPGAQLLRGPGVCRGMATTYPITNDLFLVRQSLSKKKTAAPKKVEPSVNHVLVIDCSGSMWDDLPKIREQLKKRIPKLMRKDDTLSVIWFSGRGQFGTLLESEPIASLTELQEVNSAIDRYLRPVGLTGFKEPLQEVKAVIDRVGKKNGNPFAMVFMSDGWDNQWNRSEILKAVEATAGGLNSTTVVEYGNYADRNMLTAMATKAGGTLIFAQDFSHYAPILENAITKNVSGAPRIEVEVKGDSVGGFAFALGEDEILTYEAGEGKVAVPEDLTSLWYLSSTPVGRKGKDITTLSKAGKDNPAIAAAYAAVSLFSVRMQPKVLLPVIAALGDVAFIKQFGGCFGKQAYSDFMAEAQTAAFKHDQRWGEGFDPTAVPPDDAFTVLDFLRVLNSDDDNRVLLDSKDFKYNLTSRAREDITEVTDAEGNVIQITPIKFVADKAPDGYSVGNLTFNETRPNVSILIRKEGSVDLTKRMKETGYKGKVPKQFRTNIFRNYAIIRDGVVNVDQLPVRMTGGTVRELVKQGFPMSAVRGLDGEDTAKAITRIKKAGKGRPVRFTVDLRVLPVLNRNMVKEQSAATLFETQYQLMKARGRQKILNGFKKEKFPRESKGFKILYGEDGAAWLKEQGITDYSGFGPKSKQAPATDFYMGKELKVSLKGVSSLPSFNDARKKIASGKGSTTRYKLMAQAFEDIGEFEDSKIFRNAKNQDSMFEAWLNDQLSDAKAEVKSLLYKTSQIRFGVIVGQSWFTEFSSLDETEMTISPEGSDIQAKVEMKEVEVKI